MSRCFPYTPRVCVRKGLNGEAALIESIKLQNATEKGKTCRRREEKKDKTGKTKEERNKLRGDKVKKASGQKKDKEERKAGSKRKHSETGNEQVEKSDLTVECGRPFLSQNTGYLSDSPQSNDKRSGNAMPSHCDDPKKRRIIRIRLTPGNRSEQKSEAECQQLDNSYVEQLTVIIQRPKDNSYVEQPTVTIQRLKDHSYAERPSATIQRPKVEENCFVESASAVPSDTKPEFRLPCRAQPDDKVSTSSRDRNSASNDGLHGLELLYRNLTDNWTPLPLHFGDQEVVVDDSDWLFGTVQSEKRSKKPIVKRPKFATDSQKSCQSSSMWPPRAQYLPEGGVYALPYTVPF